MAASGARRRDPDHGVVARARRTCRHDLHALRSGVSQMSSRQQSVLAYLVGAGIGGSILFAPYVGRPFVTAAFPHLRDFAYSFPFFLLPVPWGLWNLWYQRRGPRLRIGTWGAALGVLVVAGANLLLLARGQWFPVMLLAFLSVPAGYYLLWSFIVGPVNDFVGLSDDGARAPGSQGA